MRFDAILFDLDGTLTESGDGIVRSAIYALEKMNRPVPPMEQMLTFVGPPLYDSFMTYGRMTGAEADQAILHYRERYATLGWKENRAYPGIPEMLAALKAKGLYLAVATAKPEKFALDVLEYFRLRPYLDAVKAITMQNKSADKSEQVRLAMPEGAVPGRVCMVGDRKFDIEAARKNGVFAMGVSYGYGSLRELQDAGADEIADSVAALSARLMA